jgi:hypothetical protein
MRKINKQTGEISAIQVRGLWSHFPIPAYQVLAQKKQWSAQRLLCCFVSYLGDGGFCVWPTYKSISKRCGLTPNTIRKSLDVLEDYGFIKTVYFRDGKKDRNKYYFQESCWDSGKMNKVALAARISTDKCLDCGTVMDRGGYGIGPMGKIHFGCGGSVINIETSSRAKERDYTSAECLLVPTSSH